MDVKVKIGEDIKVLSPYHGGFIYKVKLLGGKWFKPYWILPLKSAHALHELLKECYGHEELSLLEIEVPQRPMPNPVTIIVNKNQVEFETAKAMLIKVPNKHPLKGYKFWLPKSLIENDYEDHYFQFYIPKTMRVIAENKSGHKLEVTNNALRQMYEHQDQEKEDFLYAFYHTIVEPEKIEFNPDELEVDESLLR